MLSCSCEIICVKLTRRESAKNILHNIAIPGFISPIYKGWAICIPKDGSVINGVVASRLEETAILVCGNEDHGYLIQILKSKKIVFSSMVEPTGELDKSTKTKFYSHLHEILGIKHQNTLSKLEFLSSQNIFSIIHSIGIPIDDGMQFSRMKLEEDLYDNFDYVEVEEKQINTNIINEGQIQAMGRFFVLESDCDLERITDLMELDAVKKNTQVGWDELLNFDTISIGLINKNGKILGYDNSEFDRCCDDWLFNLSKIGQLYVFDFNKMHGNFCMSSFWKSQLVEYLIFDGAKLIEHEITEGHKTILKSNTLDNVTIVDMLDIVGGNVYDIETQFFEEYC